MKSLYKSAVLTAFALVLLCGTAQAQCFGTYLSNGDFENGSTSWTRTAGSFSVGENPSDSSDHEGYLRGASNYTTTIEQTFTPTSSGWHAVLLYMDGYGTCTVEAKVLVGSQTYSGSDEVQYGALTYTFQIPSGVSTGTLRISVTCPNSGLGRYIGVDDVCIFPI